MVSENKVLFIYLCCIYVVNSVMNWVKGIKSVLAQMKYRIKL